MKKLFAILCLAIVSLTQLQAQVPQGFNYQATVRNSSGDLIINQNVYFKFNVIQGSQTAVPIFTETHYVPTDDLGQVNLVIGQGTANTGTFSALDWSLGSYYLGIELNTGSGYVAMGTTQLLSVPYALFAENSGNSTPTTPNLETVLAENNSANNQQIKDLLDPSDAQDAVTLAYISDLEGQIDEINLNIDHDGDGFTENQGDCDDTNSEVNQYAQEILDDSIDNDCDGFIDELSYADVALQFYNLLKKLLRPNVITLWYGDLLQIDQFAGHFAGGHSDYAWGGDFGWNYWGNLTDNGCWDPLVRYNSDLNLYMNNVSEGGSLEDDMYYALGLIIKGFYYQKFTEAFGMIPFTEASDPNITLPKYDDQLTIYKGIIADLDQAIAIIGNSVQVNNGFDELIENDKIFNGSLQLWKQVANSLKLRIALRAYGGVGEDFSATVVSEAISSGVLADNDAFFPAILTDDMWGDGTASYGDIWHTWPNSRWKTTEALINILKTSNDPRLTLMSKPAVGGSMTIDLTVRGGETSAIVEKHKDFLKSTLDDAGLVLDTDYTWVETNDELTITMDENTHYVGLPSRTNDLLQRYLKAKLFSDPADIITNKYDSCNNGQIYPTILMASADSHFMIAEAIVKGLANGDAETYYQTGLYKAMAIWGVAPTNEFSASTMGSLTGSTEEKLEKIATQRWLVNYTNGYESWSIVRDTGYPADAVITSNNNDIISLAGELNGMQVQRLRYGTSTYDLNGDNVNDAVSIQGPDNMATKLWFSK